MRNAETTPDVTAYTILTCKNYGAKDPFEMSPRKTIYLIGWSEKRQRTCLHKWITKLKGSDQNGGLWKGAKTADQLFILFVEGLMASFRYNRTYLFLLFDSEKWNIFSFRLPDADDANIL